MSVLYPLSISICDGFHPLCNTPATSLTEYLPPKRQANGLILGDGDPRKILFTLYSERGNGAKVMPIDFANERISKSIRLYVL